MPPRLLAAVFRVSAALGNHPSTKSDQAPGLALWTGLDGLIYISAWLSPARRTARLVQASGGLAPFVGHPRTTHPLGPWWHRQNNQMLIQSLLEQRFGTGSTRIPFTPRRRFMSIRGRDEPGGHLLLTRALTFRAAQAFAYGYKPGRRPA